MIQYRSFRNPDLPGLVAVWNESWTGRGAVHLPCWTPFEEFVLAKPYFDPKGLIVAEAEGRLIGFAHGGFGPDATETQLSHEDGIVGMIVVHPDYRRRGLGSELLRRCLDYLRSAGARTFSAGSVRGNPFYMGLYGGSVCTGWLASDEAAGPFLRAHGFEVGVRFDVLQRRLTSAPGIVDGRFAALRRREEFRVAERKGVRSWWHECVLGPLELTDFVLEEKATGQRTALATAWEMAGFGHRWGEVAAGLVELDVRPEQRRRGLARFLLAQAFRYLLDQCFTLVEVQVPHEDSVAGSLYRGLGFQAVDASLVYRLPG